MRNIIFIYDKSINLRSIKYILNNFKNVKKIILQDFKSELKNINIEDIILYQTFPDDKLYINKKPIENKDSVISHRKFKKKLIEDCDLNFLNLKNKIKILVDLHDECYIDGFSRFVTENYFFHSDKLKKKINKLSKEYFYNIPRIKHCPSINFKKKYNIVFDLHCHIEKHNITKNELINRNREIHYSSNDKNNILRPLIRKKLENNINKNHINLKPLNNYRISLRKILAEVNAPGWGIPCYRNVETLNAGCLLFVYDNFKDFDIIPNIKLIENEDYITFNLNNIDEKIEYILNNKDIVDKIRINGHNKFMKNYDFDKRSIEFKDFIEKSFNFKLQFH